MQIANNRNSHFRRGEMRRGLADCCASVAGEGEVLSGESEVDFMVRPMRQAGKPDLRQGSRVLNSRGACLRCFQFVEIGTYANPMIVELNAAVYVDGRHVALNAILLWRDRTTLGIRRVMTT